MVWTPNCFIRENSSQDTPSTASLLAISVLIRETSCSAVDRTKSKVPGNAEGCGSPVIMMETHGVGRGGMIVSPKSFHPKWCWNTTQIKSEKTSQRHDLSPRLRKCSTNNSQGGNVGKPQDPHRLPQLTPHISKVCLPHGGEPRHIRISSNFPSACNDLIRLSSCSSLSKKWIVTGIGQTSKINKLKILLEEKCYGKSHNLRLCVLESLKWTTCRWRIPRFWNRCSRAGFLLLSEQYGIFSNTLVGYTKTWVKWFP